MDVKKRAFAEALASFSSLMAYDRQALAGTLDANLMDAVENGMAQKFEYTLEQCWKAVKVYLKEMEGLDEASPKKTVKAFYLNGHLSEEDYGALMQAIDDRNKLSHIYEKSEFLAILERLPAYAMLMQRVLSTITRGE